MNDKIFMCSSNIEMSIFRETFLATPCKMKPPHFSALLCFFTYILITIAGIQVQIYKSIYTFNVFTVILITKNGSSPLTGFLTCFVTAAPQFLEQCVEHRKPSQIPVQ